MRNQWTTDIYELKTRSLVIDEIYNPLSTF